MTEKEQFQLPEIEGVEIPRYVRQLAQGKHNRIENSHPINGELDAKLRGIETELTSLARTDVILIEKFLNLYTQLNQIKQEIKKDEVQEKDVQPIFEQPVETKLQKRLSRTSRSSEEKRKYAAKRVDIPSSRSNSTYSDSSRDFTIQTRLSMQKNFIRVDSTRSLASSKSSRSTEEELGSTGVEEGVKDNDGDFESISMPKEGELSNLDINWFINYSTENYTT